MPKQITVTEFETRLRILIREFIGSEDEPAYLFAYETPKETIEVLSNCIPADIRDIAFGMLQEFGGLSVPAGTEAFA